MGRRVDEWERQKVERRMLRAASYGPRQAAAKLEALKQAEAERLQLRTVPDNEPDNPLGGTKAELAEMYREQRIERALDWLRMMAQMGTQWGPRGF